MSAAAPPALDAVLARIATLHPAAIDLSLNRMQRLLSQLGHPELRLPPVIHIAGTNGKGSTLSYIRAICEAAGLRVHAFTSPHLVRINESFRLAGALVGDDELIAMLAHCADVNGDAPITLFEMQTAAAFMLFANHPADVLLLEVGLGGRLDSTNVIDAPAACVLTPISLDHTEFLGDTLAAIAAEKAGIIKRGAQVICAEQQPRGDARHRTDGKAQPRGIAHSKRALACGAGKRPAGLSGRSRAA